MQYAETLGDAALKASRLISTADTDAKNHCLTQTARNLVDGKDLVLQANARDIEAATENGLTAAQIDRLRLDSARVANIARSFEEIAELPDPIGEVIESKTRPNGLEINKVRVPLGVILFIYESRPNVTCDGAAICIKSGNAVILRGGKEAFHTNQALHEVISRTLSECDLPPAAAQLVTDLDYEVINDLLQLESHINLVIPRGGPGLIRRVADNARMPVLKHYHGICHVYVHEQADLAMASQIVLNSKCQRPGVCNAAECLLVDHKIAESFAPSIYRELTASGVEVLGCDRVRSLVPEAGTASDYSTEFLDLKINMKVVDGIEHAIEHIHEFGSAHTDTIVTEDPVAAEMFTNNLDTAVAMVNVSTRFNDGGQFGLGAEVGISTDKFHARGPCGIRELTSYKYIVRGSGQLIS